MTNLVQYQNDIIIDEQTKEAFTTISGAARICGVDSASIRYYIGGRKSNLKRFKSIQSKEHEWGRKLTNLFFLN